MKLGVEAGIGDPLVLLISEPGPTYTVTGFKLLSVTQHGPSGTFVNNVVPAVPTTA